MNMKKNLKGMKEKRKGEEKEKKEEESPLMLLCIDLSSSLLTFPQSS